MAPRPTASDRLAELYLDMLAAERGAGRNTLDAYTRDLTDLSQHLAGRGVNLQRATTDDLRGFPRRPVRAATQCGVRGAQTSRQCGSSIAFSMPKVTVATIRRP